MKTLLTIGLIGYAVIYILGLAVQFHNHSMVGIVAFVAVGAFALGVITSECLRGCPAERKWQKK